MTRHLLAMKCPAAAALFVLLVLLTAVPAARGLTPPDTDKSELVFSNGGRIISIKADGSDRKVLTHRGTVDPPGHYGRAGDADPQVSPDGSKILFTRVGRDRHDLPHASRIMLSNRDGSHARRILAGGKRVSFSSPTWMPDGKSVAVARRKSRKRDSVHSVVIAGLGGKVRRTVFRLPPHNQTNLKDDLATYLMPIDLDVSPDGNHMLVTVDNGYEYDRKYLQLIDLTTGKDRLVSRSAYEGSFAPDPTKFVYVSSVGNHGKSCSELLEQVCITPGDLMIGSIAGSKPVKLTRGGAAERNPSWSQDGAHIAFESNRNLPSTSVSAEIYSIATDGSCLTWLTNGAPESVEPDWIPDSPGSSNPAACGAAGRPPLAEVKPVVSSTAPASAQLWAGPISNGRLLSWSTDFFGTFLQYEDCPAYDPASCREPFGIYGFSACFLSGILPHALNRDLKGRITRARGVALSRGTSDGSRALNVFSGDGILSIASFPGKAGFGDLREVFEDLRPLNSTSIPDRLPRFRLPRRDIKLMKRVVRRVKKRGSVKRAAKSLGMGPGEVRSNVKMSRLLPRVGPYRTVGCPKGS